MPEGESLDGTGAAAASDRVGPHLDKFGQLGIIVQRIGRTTVGLYRKILVNRHLAILFEAIGGYGSYVRR